MSFRHLLDFRRLVLIPIFFFLIQSQFLKPLPVKRIEYLAPSKYIQNIAFGMKIQLADSFWLRAIQDFDYCDQIVNDKECKGKSWLFHILDLTTDLDEHFFHAFHWGGLALSIIISDYSGASIIFDKGVKLFPNEWLLLYSAAYHALFEEKDKLKASNLYFEAAKNGAPKWVRLMAGRLAAESGEKEFAAKILSAMIEMSDDPRYIKKLKKKLEALESTSQ